MFFVKQKKLPFAEEKLQTLTGIEEFGFQAVVMLFFLKLKLEISFISYPVEIIFVCDTDDLQPVSA